MFVDGAQGMVVGVDSSSCYCFPGHCLVQFDQIMRWCCSNFGQRLLKA